MKFTTLAALGFVGVSACAHSRPPPKQAAQAATFSSCTLEDDWRSRVPAWECPPTVHAPSPALERAAREEPAKVTDAVAKPQMDSVPRQSDATFEGEVQRVQGLVQELSEPGWKNACRGAADTLDALASALRAHAGSDRRVRRAARNVWADARSLRRACAGSFEAADLIRSGLQASLGGLERALDDAADEQRMRARLDVARAAVETLDPGTSWVFQRARVQDAFRTVSTAFVAAAEHEAEGQVDAQPASADAEK
jgi:hypothetical protein